MKIEQVEVNRDNILELAQRTDMYVVKFSVNLQARSKKKPYPYGLSFAQLSAKFTIADLFKILDDKEYAVVKVIKD